MAVTIDALELQINASAQGATRQINRLVKALSGIAEIGSVSGGLQSVANAIQRISEMSEGTSVATKGINRFARAMANLTGFENAAAGMNSVADAMARVASSAEGVASAAHAIHDFNVATAPRSGKKRTTARIERAAANAEQKNGSAGTLSFEDEPTHGNGKLFNGGRYRSAHRAAAAARYRFASGRRMRTSEYSREALGRNPLFGEGENYTAQSEPYTIPQSAAGIAARNARIAERAAKRNRRISELRQHLKGLSGTGVTQNDLYSGLFHRYNPNIPTRFLDRRFSGGNVGAMRNGRYRNVSMNGWTTQFMRVRQEREENRARNIAEKQKRQAERQAQQFAQQGRTEQLTQEEAEALQRARQMEEQARQQQSEQQASMMRGRSRLRFGTDANRRYLPYVHQYGGQRRFSMANTFSHSSTHKPSRWENFRSRVADWGRDKLSEAREWGDLGRNIGWFARDKFTGWRNEYRQAKENYARYRNRNAPRRHAEENERNQRTDRNVRRNNGSLFGNRSQNRNSPFKNMIKDLKQVRALGKSALQKTIVGQGLSKMHGFLKSFMKMGLARLLRRLLATLFSGIKEGINNLYKFSKALGSGKNGFATAMNTLASKALVLKNSFATMLAPAIQALVPILSTITALATRAFNAIAQLVSVFAGLTSWTKASSDALAEYTGAASSAGGSTNELLADFDELNVIASSGGGGSSGYITPISAMFGNASYEDWVEEIKKLIDGGDWEGLGTFFGDKLNKAIEKINLPNLGEKLGEKIQNALETVNGFIAKFDAKGLGGSIGEFVNRAIGKISATDLGTFMATKIVLGINLVGGFLGKVNAGDLAGFISGAGIAFCDAITDAIEGVNWDDVRDKLVEFINGLNIDGLLTAFGNMVWAAMRAAIKLAIGVDIGGGSGSGGDTGSGGSTGSGGNSGSGGTSGKVSALTGNSGGDDSSGVNAKAVGAVAAGTLVGSKILKAVTGTGVLGWIGKGALSLSKTPVGAALIGAYAAAKYHSSTEGDAEDEAYSSKYGDYSVFYTNYGADKRDAMKALGDAYYANTGDAEGTMAYVERMGSMSAGQLNIIASGGTSADGLNGLLGDAADSSAAAGTPSTKDKMNSSTGARGVIAQALNGSAKSKLTSVISNAIDKANSGASDSNTGSSNAHLVSGTADNGIWEATPASTTVGIKFSTDGGSGSNLNTVLGDLSKKIKAKLGDGAKVPITPTKPSDSAVADLASKVQTQLNSNPAKLKVVPTLVSKTLKFKVTSGDGYVNVNKYGDETTTIGAEANGALDIDAGQLFIAREAGPELVGSMGHYHNTVANNQQIVEGISAGVANANAETNAILMQQNSLLQAILAKDTSVRLAASTALGKIARQSVKMYEAAAGV